MACRSPCRRLGVRVLWIRAERRTLLEQKLKEVGTSLTSLRTQRLEREALYNQMRRASNPEELPDVMRSPLVQSLRIELANLEREKAQLLERYGEQHPEVIAGVHDAVDRYGVQFSCSRGYVSAPIYADIESQLSLPISSTMSCRSLAGSWILFCAFSKMRPSIPP